MIEVKIQKVETETFSPKSQKEWRQWLKANHRSKQSVWLVLYKKKTGKPTIAWSEAVDEALCFGWVDSKRKPVDGEKFIQFFSKRKPKGTWSKVNKAKVKQLIENKLMTKAGLECIEAAKQNGSWTILDEVEELTIPDDLDKHFRTKPDSKTFYSSLSKSVRKRMLQWLVLAKRPETRLKRIRELVNLANQKKIPQQLRS
jgi:uncharacterized protein YdeI (YjbR/CyaY-like superfamily)